MGLAHENAEAAQVNLVFTANEDQSTSGGDRPVDHCFEAQGLGERNKSCGKNAPTNSRNSWMVEVEMQEPVVTASVYPQATHKHEKRVRTVALATLHWIQATHFKCYTGCIEN